ncbi:magnesium chelatase [Rhodoferax sp. TH121]|uniref:vWA domain-containing protein n=1 Tax=Rhodoferax sp. TH121 TaxID=2022803 RepID=UPI000B95F821|nr:VWA domain-containing protein [Rhodoferax sp. TH121]OYQ40288.1 magnesium chelatase [Rhodoferax sp. TH121]
MAAKKSLGHPSRRPRNGPGSWRWPPPQNLSAPAAPGARHHGTAIAWLPTVVAKGPAPLQRTHLRYQPIAVRAGRLHCIVLDTSGSMRQRGRLALAKGHAAFMIEQAARQGEDVALLRFGGQGVELLLPPGRARLSGSQRLRPLGGGGGTPLAEALGQADRLLQRTLRMNGSVESWLWLLTDGRSLERPRKPQLPQHLVIVDFDDRTKTLGRCAAWAAQWGADYQRASA